jgi:hypothetical protein
MNPISQGEGDLLARIREGMPVYGPDGQRLGSVRTVQLADDNDPVDVREERLDARDEERPSDTRSSGAWTPLEVFRELFVDVSPVPDELQRRLQREGFVEIAGGLAHPRRYALASQVDRVVDGDVILGVAGDALMRA